MNHKKYNEYLKSEQWQEKRKQKALEQGYRCEICFRQLRTGFHIHHKTYKNFGNEPMEDLMFLCKKCHEKIHKGEIKVLPNNRKKKKIIHFIDKK